MIQLRAKDLTLMFIGLVAIGFLIGWLFPIEGPYDEKYEKFEEQQAYKKRSVVNVAAPQKTKKLVISVEDLEELLDEEHEYYFIPFTLEERE